MKKTNLFGNKIREIRKSNGLTQEQLAEKAGIDNKHLSKIENGLHLPTYKTLQKLFEALNINNDDMEYYGEIIKNNDSAFLKSLEILNSAKNDKEKNYYYEVLSLAQKGLKLK